MKEEGKGRKGRKGDKKGSREWLVGKRVEKGNGEVNGGSDRVNVVTLGEGHYGKGMTV